MTTSMDSSSLKNYALPITAALVTIVLVPLMIIPWIGNIQTDWQDLQAKQDLREQLTLKANMLEQTNNQVNQELLLEKAEPAMPSQADPSGVLATLEQVASAAGVQTKGARFAGSDSGSEPASATGGMVKVSVTIEGSYAGIFSFISQSESVARVINMETLQIASSNAGSADQLVATFDVTAPYAPLPTDLGPVETPLPEMGQAQTALLDKAGRLVKASYAATTPASITGRPNPF